MFQDFLVGMVTGVGVLLIVFGVSFTRRREDQIQARLEQLKPTTLEELEMQQPFSDRVLTPVRGKLSGIVRHYTPERTMENIRKQLIVAGNPKGWTVNDFLGIKGVAALVLAVIGFLLGGLLKDLLMALGAVVLFAMIGFILPSFWLGGKIKARQREIQLALPDALDLFSICVDAGLGFDAAMQKVAAKWDNALMREFDRILADIGLGKTRREALRDMATRCDVPDVSAFCASIIQADALGVSISRILTLQSEQMRMKRRQRAEKAAHEAPVKMLIPMVLFILPSIYVVILGPMVPRIIQMMHGG